MFPLLDILGPIVQKALDFIPDPAMKAKAQADALAALNAQQQQLMAAIVASDKSQADINAEEAKSTSMFIAGWRPFLGWVLTSSFAWVYVVQPVLTFTFAVFHRSIELPTLDFSQMSTVLMGMLGLAGMRTYEKRTDSESNR